ncbi:putative deoxyribonuclease TATDN2, partial [Stegodyphus mimosarum]
MKTSPSLRIFSKALRDACGMNKSSTKDETNLLKEMEEKKDSKLLEETVSNVEVSLPSAFQDSKKMAFSDVCVPTTTKNALSDMKLISENTNYFDESQSEAVDTDASLKHCYEERIKCKSPSDDLEKLEVLCVQSPSFTSLYGQENSQTASSYQSPSTTETKNGSGFKKSISIINNEFVNNKSKYSAPSSRVSTPKPSSVSRWAYENKYSPLLKRSSSAVDKDVNSTPKRFAIEKIGLKKKSSYIRTPVSSSQWEYRNKHSPSFSWSSSESDKSPDSPLQRLEKERIDLKSRTSIVSQKDSNVFQWKYDNKYSPELKRSFSSTDDDTDSVSKNFQGERTDLKDSSFYIRSPSPRSNQFKLDKQVGRRSFPFESTNHSSSDYRRSCAADQTPDISTENWTKRFKGILPSYSLQNLMCFKSDSGFIDAHCHLDFLFQRLNFEGTFSDYKKQLESTFPECYQGCIAVFCNPFTFPKKLIWQKFLEEEKVWGAFGCHPHNSKNYSDSVERALCEALQHHKVRALGEIGLDYSNRNNCLQEVQKSVLRRQLKIAKKERLPLVIHCREANEDCMEI